MVNSDPYTCGSANLAFRCFVKIVIVTAYCWIQGRFVSEPPGLLRIGGEKGPAGGADGATGAASVCDSYCSYGSEQADQVNKQTGKTTREKKEKRVEATRANCKALGLGKEWQITRVGPARIR